MNLKRIFGALLTILGIVGLIYAAVIFAGTSGETGEVKSMIIYGILGVVFFCQELVWFVLQKTNHSFFPKTMHKLC